MTKFAVIDTETTWDNGLMSVGVVISDDKSFKVIERAYYVLDPEYKKGGMYAFVLSLKEAKPTIESRRNTIASIQQLLQKHGIQTICAYNAPFDRKLLPELDRYEWIDILRLAAYRQHNPKITPDMEICATGRLKSHYGVEHILRMMMSLRVISSMS